MSASDIIYPAVSIGVANIFIEWLFIGFLFHKSQAATPHTWRRESKKSYARSMLLSLLFGFLFTLFYLKIGFHYVVHGNILYACKYGLFCFAVFAVLPELSAAIYVNVNRGFVAGKLFSSLFCYLAAAVIVASFQ